MTRILIVAHAHPEERPTGAELAAYALFQALRDRQDYEAHFAAPRILPRLFSERLTNWEGRAQEWELPTGEVERFLISQRSEGALAALAALIERIQPDVIHFHHYMRSGVEALGLARHLCPSARILLTLHEYQAICANNGQMVTATTYALCEQASPAACTACFPKRTVEEFGARRRFILANLLKADVLVAPSEFLRQRYIRWGVPPSRIVMVENYLPSYSPLPPRPMPPSRRRDAFGFFGTIGVFKGVRTLIEAFRLLRKMPGGAEATLSLHGLPGYQDAGFRSWFDTALTKGGPGLRWGGPYSRTDLPGLMSQVDWVVVPSIWWENSPLVIQEAFMFGRPLIVSNIGGMKEKVENGVYGFTFQVGDPRALAETMAFAIPRFEQMRQQDMMSDMRQRLQAVLALYTKRTMD